MYEQQNQKPKQGHQEQIGVEDETEKGKIEDDAYTETQPNTASLRYRLCMSGRGENFGLKAVFGAIGGFMFGGIIFILLAFSFNYDYAIAGWITFAATVLMCIGLAVSVYFRCIILLMVPTLFTGRGRVAFLSIIFTIMLVGPVINISHNAKEVASSMSCVSELAYNQSQELKKQLQEPIRKIAQTIHQQILKLQKLADGLIEALKPVTKVLGDMQNGLEAAANALKEAAKKCESGVDNAKSECKKGIKSAYEACKKELSKWEDAIVDVAEDVGGGIVDIGTGIGNGIGGLFGKRKRRSIMERIIKARQRKDHKFNHLNDYTYSKNPVFNESELNENQIADLHIYTQLQRRLGTNTSLGDGIIEANSLLYRYATKENVYVESSTHSVYPNASYRFKRCALCGVCEPLDFASGICDVLKVGTEVCKLPALIGGAVNTVASGTKKLIEELENFFKFGVNGDFGLSGGVNSSKSAAQIQSEVKNDIQAKTTWVNSFVNILSRFMALSLLLLFIKSIFYIRKYLAKDYFDNIYITKEFKIFDEMRGLAGKSTVLPLRRRERRKYIDTTSILMSHKELKNCTSGGLTVCLHLAVTTLVIAGDFVLYYILSIMIKYGESNVNVAGVTQVNIDVTGSGILSAFLRAFANGLHLDNDYDVNFNLTTCLPDPTEPDTGNIFILVFLYFVAFMFIFMQAYGLRTRRKIASFYYPEQEMDRMYFLHDKITHNRATLLSWLAQYLPSRRKERDISERITLSAMFYYRCPWFATTCGNCKPEKPVECLSCSQEEDGLTEFYICKTPRCTAVYCMHCYEELDEGCILCKTDEYN